jgi:dethiobiotin synthetase
MSKLYFVTGTDTDAGKTLVAAGILEKAKSLGFSTLGLKPVASGCDVTPQGLRNSDALLLQQASSIKLDYEQVNPVAFEPAIAPHIAAKQINKTIQAERLVGYCRGALFEKPELCLIEGAGGWRVPLNDREYFSALPKSLSIPVILVVGMKLGCINHALLTAETIRRDGLVIAGWVANQTSAMNHYAENLSTLCAHMPAPLLAEIPCLADPEPSQAAAYFDLAKLSKRYS